MHQFMYLFFVWCSITILNKFASLFCLFKSLNNNLSETLFRNWSFNASNIQKMYHLSWFPNHKFWCRKTILAYIKNICLKQRSIGSTVQVYTLKKNITISIFSLKYYFLLKHTRTSPFSPTVSVSITCVTWEISDNNVPQETKSHNVTNTLLSHHPTTFSSLQRVVYLTWLRAHGANYDLN